MVGKGKVENLKPLKKGEKRTKEIASKGGKASQKVQRAKLNMKEQLEILWNLPVTSETPDDDGNDRTCIDITSIKSFADVSGQNVEAGMAGLSRLMQRWINKGDPRDGEFISKILGLYIQKAEIENGGIPVVLRDDVPNPYAEQTKKGKKV